MKVLKTFIIAAFFLDYSGVFAQETASQDCQITKPIAERILQEVERKNPDAIKVLPICFKLDRKLMFKVALADPYQFQNAAEILRSDENFVGRLIKVNPAILQFADLKMRADPLFMQRATYLHRDALQYAETKLLDNRIFMKKMINIDSRNYIFASERLKEIPEFAEIAFEDNGLLLEFAPKKIQSNFKLVKVALRSNGSAIEFVSEKLRKDKSLLRLTRNKNSIKFNPAALENLRKFLQKNYLVEEKKKNLGFSVSNKAKFFGKNVIIDRNYVTKWQRNVDYENGIKVGENWHLISADSRNYQTRWQDDFKKYPELIAKIEKFFYRHNLDKATIDRLYTTYLWKIKSQPFTLAFNLYLLRESDDADLAAEFANITSLTAIAQRRNNKWEMTVVEVIFDSEIKTEVAYSYGHKKYFLWDLYELNDKDKSPKIIFKIEDKFRDYFEVFEEQNGGKYQMVCRFEPKFKVGN